MAEQLEQAIQAAQDEVTKQGDTVRSLKASLKDGKVEKVRLGAFRLIRAMRTVHAAGKLQISSANAWHAKFTSANVPASRHAVRLRADSASDASHSAAHVHGAVGRPGRQPPPPCRWPGSRPHMARNPPPRPQSAVDGAIQKLQELKIVLDTKQKVSAERAAAVTVAARRAVA